jgi:hypothetical protein
MNNTSMPGIFSRYTQEKYNRFQTWLSTKHGTTVYALFRQFSEMSRNAGHARCGANLVGNRIRWEMSVGKCIGYKVSNDFLPMLLCGRWVVNRKRLFPRRPAIHAAG